MPTSSQGTARPRRRRRASHTSTESAREGEAAGVRGPRRAVRRRGVRARGPRTRDWSAREASSAAREECVAVERRGELEVVRRELVGERDAEVRRLVRASARVLHDERVHAARELDGPLRASAPGAPPDRGRPSGRRSTPSPPAPTSSPRARASSSTPPSAPTTARSDRRRPRSRERTARATTDVSDGPVHAAPLELAPLEPRPRQRRALAHASSADHDRRERRRRAPERPRSRTHHLVPFAPSFSRQNAMFFWTRSRSFSGSALPERRRWLSAIASL